jgi:hypothetical protein
VVGFSGMYHAILGRSVYAKFIAVPNYTYLKLKGVITIDTKFQHADECGTECFQFAEMLIRSEKITVKPSTVDLDDTTWPSKLRIATSFLPESTLYFLCL